MDVFPPLHPTCSDDHISPIESENSLEEKTTIYEKMGSPSKILQKFIEAAIQCHTDKMSKSVSQRKYFFFVSNRFIPNLGFHLRVFLVFQKSSENLSQFYDTRISIC